MHAPFERQAERKMKAGEGLFSLRLPKFESYQPGMLNAPAAIRRVRATPGEIFAAAARW
jgi:hypothetical protein